MSNYFTRKWFPVITVVALTASLLAPGTARGQFGEAAGIAEAMQPEFFRRDVVLFVDSLRLDESQQMLLEMLYEDYLDGFDEGRARMEERMSTLQNELKGAPKEDVLALVFKPIQDWTQERQELGRGFISNIKLVVLNTEQLELWPMFEQRLYREKVLREGRLAGESINLFHVLRDLSRSRRADERALMVLVESILENYSADLHQALVARKKAKRSTQKNTLAALQTMNAAQSVPAMNNLIRTRIRVREVNDQYIEMITNTLPDKWGPLFRQATLERGYPRVYRTTPYERILNEARELEEITEETRMAIEELIRAFESELSVVNDDLLQVLQRYEPVKMREQTEAYVARMNQEPFIKSHDPMRPKLEKRAAMGRTYLQTLQTLLTEEQFNSISGARRWATQPRTTGPRKSRGEHRKSTGGKQPPRGGSTLKQPGGGK